MNQFQIFHYYDLGDQPAFVCSDKDPTEEALYCQFMAEEWIDEGVSLPNDVIANALIEFYGCKQIPKDSTKYSVEIDMYFAREEACGDTYNKLMNSSIYERVGLKEFLVRAVQESLMEQAKQRGLQFPGEEISVELSDTEVFKVTCNSESGDLECSRLVIGTTRKGLKKVYS